MEILEKNEKSWKIPVTRDESGEIQRYLAKPDLAEPGDKVDFVENFYFRAVLTLDQTNRTNGLTVRRAFTDAKNGTIFLFTPSAIDRLLEALEEGSIEATNAGFEGVWTFSKIAESRTARPVSREELAKKELG